MKNFIIFIYIILFITVPATSTFPATWLVGPGYTYAVPSAVSGLVNNGDTVYIAAGYYEGDCAAWTKDNLYLRATGGTVHLEANGNYIWGKGIWVCAGNNIRVEGIEFSGASVPDHNGAGIRLDGSGLHVKGCYFHDNENGILGGNSGNIIIEQSEFGHNGYGDGYSHNIYINHADTLIITSSYFHHAYIGHEIKSRAHVNIITYNRISNEDTGRASREIDLPNGGFAFICGNIIQQGPMAENGNMLAYGAEGLSNNPPHKIYVINNTFVDQRHNNGRFLDIATGTELLKAYNNIFAGGPAVVLTGSALTTDTAGNWVCADENNAGFTGLLSYDYNLLSSSPAIGTGIQPGYAGSLNLMPLKQYVHPLQTTGRTIYGNIDAGAYEYDPTTETKDISFILNDLKYIYSDNRTLQISSLSGFDHIVISDISGRILYHEAREGCHSISISTIHFSKQILICTVINRERRQTIKVPIF